MRSPAQHIVPTGVIFFVGCWITWISFTQEPADSFLFPRMISVVYIVLAAWTFGRAILRISRVGEGVSGFVLSNMAPGLIIALIYVFVAAKSLGFYTATAIAFFALISVYDPAPHNEVKSWIRRVVITACYVGIMYGVFAQLLGVFTPHEVLF